MKTSPVETFIAFDPEKCIQCMGCQTACKTWRQLPNGVLFRVVENLWIGDQFPRIKSMSLSLGCLHCVSPQCLETCPVDAISKDKKTGLVNVNTELCIGCRLCSKSCPYNIPQYDADNKMMKCDLCNNRYAANTPPPCVSTCPGKALEVIAGSPKEKHLHQKFISGIVSTRQES